MNSASHPGVRELLRDPALMLYSIDFPANEALFHRVSPELPTIGCYEVRNREPLRVPLHALGGAGEQCNPRKLPPVPFIWMTDFCGSTLFARGLNETPGLYLYNETRVFTDLANAKRFMDAGRVEYPIEQWRYLLRLALLFYSRSPAARDTSFVKEWPVSNYILDEILGATRAQRGIFMYSGLRQYLLKCLGRPVRCNLARTRIESIFIELPAIPALSEIDVRDLTDGQCVALHWLYLMYWHQQRGYGDDERLRTLNSDEFFAEPARCLRRSAKYFGRELSRQQADRIVAGPVFRRHSKRVSNNFSMAQHEASFEEAEREVGGEADDVMAWTEQILERHPLPASPGRDLLE